MKTYTVYTKISFTGKTYKSKVQANSYQEAEEMVRKKVLESIQLSASIPWFERIWFF